MSQAIVNRHWEPTDWRMHLVREKTHRDGGGFDPFLIRSGTEKMFAFVIGNNSWTDPSLTEGQTSKICGYGFTLFGWMKPGHRTDGWRLGCRDGREAGTHTLHHYVYRGGERDANEMEKRLMTVEEADLVIVRTHVHIHGPGRTGSLHVWMYRFGKDRVDAMFGHDRMALMDIFPATFEELEREVLWRCDEETYDVVDNLTFGRVGYWCFPYYGGRHTPQEGRRWRMDLNRNPVPAFNRRCG